MKTVQQAGDKYARRVGQAGPDYTAGVQNASSWSEGAVAASARRDAGLQQAIADGRINAGITRTGDAGWKTKTLAKGPTAYQASVANARPKYEAGMQVAMGFQQAAQSATANIDTSTQAGRLQKMMVWAQTVSEQAAARKRTG